MKETFTTSKPSLPINLLPMLYEQDVVQFGSFVLKSGTTSSVYVDMRNAISSAVLLRMVAEALHNAVPNQTYDRICGVPYGAVPLATALALHKNMPLIMVRKEIKDHGTQKLVESRYTKGDRVLVVEDVVTTGSSILETIDTLEKHGLLVEGVVVFLDREQGGVDTIQKRGYRVHTVTTLSELLAYRNPKN